MQNKNVEMKSQKSKTVKNKKPKTLAYADTWRGLHAQVVLLGIQT